MTNYLNLGHSVATLVTALCWAIVSITAALAAIYHGPSTPAYAGVVDRRRWYRRVLACLLCFATAARAVVVLDGSKVTTWDDVVIAVVLALLAAFYWARYISDRRLPDPRDELGGGR